MKLKVGNYFNPEIFGHGIFFTCRTSEAMTLGEGECCVTCVNGNHVYNEILCGFFFWSAALNITQNITLCDMPLCASPGSHCLLIIVDIKALLIYFIFPVNVPCKVLTCNNKHLGIMHHYNIGLN